MAPYGGFLAVKNFWPPLQRRILMLKMVAACGGKNVTSLFHTLASIFSIGVISSKIHIERPWVASTRSFSRAWIWISSTGTVGKLFFRAVQFAPRSQETH